VSTAVAGGRGEACLLVLELGLPLLDEGRHALAAVVLRGRASGGRTGGVRRAGISLLAGRPAQQVRTVAKVEWKRRRSRRKPWSRGS